MSIRVAVVTPYYNESSDVLRTCAESVRQQTYPCTHYMIADGMPREEVGRWGVEHIVLARPHGDSGNTPRAVGSMSAMNQGAEAIAYLDADNWYYPGHIEAMVRLHETSGAAVCTASRTLHRLDGSLLYADHECDGRNHVDTSCFYFTSAAFRVLPLWGMMPASLGPICDTVMWRFIRMLGLTCAHCVQPTVAFRTQYAAHYRFKGEVPPAGAKENSATSERAVSWWNELPAEKRTLWETRMGFQR